MATFDYYNQGWVAMRDFNYAQTPPELLSQEVMRSIALLYEHKGRQALFIEQRPAELKLLCEVAKIQSTGASNRIEGISTTDGRLNAIMSKRVAPRNRNEQEIAGYRDVLTLIHESYDAIGVTPNTILQLHKILYQPTGYSFGGKWKDSDNVIAEIDEDGHRRVRFAPPPAIAVPDAMERLCNAYNQAIWADAVDPLLLTAMFVFDFVCIHPFNDGNGRMSRLLTLLLLYRSGYLVGKYVSIEHEIERSKETYYESLRSSSDGWNEATNTYLPFVSYFLGCLIRASRIFEERLEGVVVNRTSKPNRIELLLSRSMRDTSKADILAQCPDISPTTANRTLSALLKAGKIQKIGGGRGTRYRWVR